MNKKLTIRLLILFITLAIALVLFILNLRRSSPVNLPPTPTMDATATALHQTQTFMVDQPYPSETPSATPEMTSTQEIGITPSLQYETPTISVAEITATSEAMQFQATEQAQSMVLLVEQLYDGGIIGSTEGEFHEIPDFSQSWDKPGYFQWWRTEYKLKEFVLRANVSWKSTDPSPDTSTTGCGLIFADNGSENMVRSFLFLDGHIRVYRMLTNKFDDLAYGYYSQTYSPSGNAEVVYVVQGRNLHIYINNELVIEQEIDYLSDGYIGFAITSGTAEGYLMNCDMFNIELWTFPE